MNFRIIKYFALISTIIIFTYCSDNKNNTNSDEVVKRVDSSSFSSINNQIRESPDNPDLFFLRAEYYNLKGEVENSIKDILSAISLDSINPKYYIKLAEYNLFLGKSGVSKEALEKCLLLEPDNLEAILKLAEIQLYVKQYDESISLLNKAQKIDPLSAKTYFIKSIIYKENGDTTRAIESLQISLEKDPNQYSALIMLGRLYFQKRDSIAIDYFKNAIKLNPSSIEAYYNIAMFYQENNQPFKAIDEYNLILSDIDSTYFYAHYNIGYINLEILENYSEAIENFSQVIKMKPDYYQAFHNRGLAQELLGILNKAKIDYKTTLKLMPNYNLSIEGLNRIDSINNK